MRLWLRELFLNALFLGGFGALAYGCWLAYRPAGFIVPGALSLAAALWVELRR